MMAITATPKLPVILRSVARSSPSTSISLSLSLSLQPQRPFQTSFPPLLGKNKNLPPRPKPPPEEEIDESFLKGSGPGGQKINKTSSAVQLKHLPTGIVVKSQATRSRSQNRAIARQLLADKLDGLARGDQSRAAVVGAVRSKKKASAAKKSRRKYRKLVGGEGEEGEEEEEGEEGQGEEEEQSRQEQEQVEQQEEGREGPTTEPNKEKVIRGARLRFVR